MLFSKIVAGFEVLTLLTMKSTVCLPFVACWFLAFLSLHLWRLMCSSEMSLDFYWTIQRYIPEGSIQRLLWEKHEYILWGKCRVILMLNGGWYTFLPVWFEELMTFTSTASCGWELLCYFASGNLTAATDIVVLEMHHINHILTVDSCPLPRKIAMLPGVKTKFLQGTV